MKPEIRRADTWSFNGGSEIIENKGLKQELPAIAESYIDHGGGNQYLNERRGVLVPLGWEQEIYLKFETTNYLDFVSRRTSFGAYKDGIVVELRAVNRCARTGTS